MDDFEHEVNEPSHAEVNGAAGEVLADYDTGRVVARFLNPESGEMVVELHLHPEVAREFAANLTAASISVEEHQKRH